MEVSLQAAPPLCRLKPELHADYAAHAVPRVRLISSPRAAILDPQQVFAEVGTVGGELDGHLKFAQG